MSWLIAAHATGAGIALALGGFNLRRSPKGDLLHRRVGVVWVALMYWTVLSSFAITDLNPGHFSWIHGLSVFTFFTLSIGLWAAITGRVEHHRGFMTGSYFGLIGAFIGAVVVPSRHVPQLAVNEPVSLAFAIALCVASAVLVIRVAGRTQNRPQA